MQSYAIVLKHFYFFKGKKTIRLIALFAAFTVVTIVGENVFLGYHQGLHISEELAQQSNSTSIEVTQHQCDICYNLNAPNTITPFFQLTNLTTLLYIFPQITAAQNVLAKIFSPLLARAPPKA